MRNAIALLRLLEHDPLGATAALAPVLDGSVRVHPVWVVAALLLEAIARDELGDPAAVRAIERALDLAGPDHMFFPFLAYPVPALLERHARDCAKHAPLVAEILSLLSPTGTSWSPPGGPSGGGQPLPGGHGGRAVPHEQGGSGGIVPPG